MRLRDTVRSTHGQDGAVALDLRAGQMFRMNLVGSRIVELLGAGRTEVEIANTVAAEFSVDRTVAASDIREFLAQLEGHHLLQDETETRPSR